jgi:hypothetical protein
MIAMRRVRVAAAVVALAALPVLAQQSATYRISDHAVNAAGHPQQGTVVSSASFRVTLDSLGDGILGTGMASASYHADGGFTGSYPPPGEVHGLRWDDAISLAWDAERSAGVYELYRDDLGALPGTSGTCLQSALATTSATDAATPGPGVGWFYLVSVRNRLGEESTTGFDSDGVERPNLSPCP